MAESGFLPIWSDVVEKNRDHQVQVTGEKLISDELLKLTY